MDFERHKTASIGAGLVVAVILIGALGYHGFLTYRDMMFRPKEFHRRAATKALEEIIGADARGLVVPAVNADIDLIYVTTILSEASVSTIRSQGVRRLDMPGEVLRFNRLQGTLMFSLSTTPARIMVGPATDTPNAERCVSRYREWLEHDRLPWRE